MKRILVAAIAALALWPAAAAAQQVIPGVNFILTIDGSAVTPPKSYINDRDLGPYRIGANNEGFSAGGTLRWDYNASRLKLSSGYTLDWNTTSIDATDIGYIDGLTPGTATASKALVIDANKDLATLRHLTISGNLVTGSTTLSETELGYVDGLTPGTVTASKAMVVDANKDIASLRNVTLSTVIGAGGQTLDVSSADVTELRRSTNAQVLRVYKTFTNASNYERLSLTASGTNFTITTEAAGTGSARELTIGGGSVLNLSVNSSVRWYINGSGHLLSNSDNTYDIGASGATRPRSIYTSSAIFVQHGSAGIVLGGAGATAGLYAGGNGILRLLDDAATSFNRLQFGGTTSSFPALKRSGTDIEIKLADDSGYAQLRTGSIGLGAAPLTSHNTIIFGERSDPTAPSANEGILYIRDNGAGKTQIVVRFPTGAVQVIATEP